MLFFYLLNYFPENISKILEEYFKEETKEKEKLIEEIHLRTNKPLILKFSNYEKIFKHTVTSEEILETMGHICDNSIYAYQNELCNGFITIKGGHRVGVTGSIVIENNRVININYISSLNIRIAKQILGCSNKILKYVLNLEENNVYNTLIVSPPGERKNYNIKGFNKKNK